MIDKNLQKRIIKLFEEGKTLKEISAHENISLSMARDYVLFYYSVASIKELKKKILEEKGTKSSQNKGTI